MTRERTHMRAFTAALESMEKPQFAGGIIEPTPVLVDQFLLDQQVKVTMARWTIKGRGIAGMGSIRSSRR